jgi:hypothetical protein
MPVLGGSDELIAIYSNQPQHWNRYTYALNNPHLYVDRDGENPLIAAGAVAGAIIGGGAKIIEFKVEGKPIKLREVVGAAVGGAITGAIAGATGGGSLIGSVGVGMIGGVGGGIVERAIGGREVFSEREIRNDLIGGVVGGATSKLAVGGAAKLLAKSRTMNSIAELAPELAYDALAVGYSYTRKYLLLRTGISTRADRVYGYGYAFLSSFPHQFAQQGYGKATEFPSKAVLDIFFSAISRPDMSLIYAAPPLPPTPQGAGTITMIEVIEYVDELCTLQKV